MSLKHIRENYARLLNAFKEAGVKLTESQKKDIDGFMLALESSMEQTKQSTINATRKVVEEKLSKEYRAVVESILKHQQEYFMLASKIQDRMTKVNESQKIARAVDTYLDSALKEALPEKSIIDYDRLNKLETVFESLKDTLLVNDAAVEAKRAELTEAFETDRKALDSKISKLEKQLNESISREQKLATQLEAKKAKELLEKKTADLPLFEAQQVKRRFAGATCAEIEKNFKKLLESVREEMKEACNEEEKTLEEEVNEIITRESSNSENKKDDTEEKKVEEAKDEEAKSDKKDEVDESKEEDDDVQLEESEKIPAALMQRWLSRTSTIVPIG